MFSEQTVWTLNLVVYLLVDFLPLFGAWLYSYYLLSSLVLVLCHLTKRLVLSALKFLSCSSFTLTLLRVLGLSFDFHTLFPTIQQCHCCSLPELMQRKHALNPFILRQDMRFEIVQSRNHMGLYFLGLYLGGLYEKNLYGILPFSFVENLGGITAKYHELGCEYIGLQTPNHLDGKGI